MRGAGFSDVRADMDAASGGAAHRTNGHSEIEYSFIEVRDAGTGLEQVSGLYKVWHEDAVDEEAGTVLHDHRQFADLAHKLQGALQDLRRSLAGNDDLNQLHSVNRVEEMQAENTFGPARARGKFGNRQCRRVGCQDG